LSTAESVNSTIRLPSTNLNPFDHRSPTAQVFDHGLGSGERRGQVRALDDFGERTVEISGDQQTLGGRQLLNHPSIASRF
jgi:hypothetical protein